MFYNVYAHRIATIWLVLAADRSINPTLRSFIYLRGKIWDYGTELARGNVWDVTHRVPEIFFCWWWQAWPGCVVVSYAELPPCAVSCTLALPHSGAFHVGIDAKEERGMDPEVTGRGEVSYVSVNLFDHDSPFGSWQCNDRDFVSPRRN